jgi:prevent-host-death family protein
MTKKFSTKVIGLSEARAKFSQLVREVASSKKSYLITRNSAANAALVNAEWLEGLLAEVATVRAQGKEVVKMSGRYGDGCLKLDPEVALRKIRRQADERLIARAQRLIE